MILWANRARCRIPLGEPDDCGLNWGATRLLPAPAASWPGKQAAPRTEVRALAGDKELFIRFDSFLDDPARLRPRTPAQALGEGEHVYMEVFPYNDPTEWFRIRADFRGVSDVTLNRRMPGEKSLEAVPDLWQTSTPLGGAALQHRVYHSLTRERWSVEIVVPWRMMGLARRPVTIGLHYGRMFATGRAWPPLAEAAWPAVQGPASRTPFMQRGEALLGAEAGAPESLELDEPRFGANAGRLALGEDWPRRPDLVRVRTEGPEGRVAATADFPVEGDTGAVEFRYRLDRGLSSHADVFAPQRVVLEAMSAGETLYSVRWPMDRHLGLCVEEPFGEAASMRVGGSRGSRRDEWLDRMTCALPRLHRATTAQGAPSDFCLLFDDGRVAANLMADDPWRPLAALVEEGFASTEDRLVAALALVGQKSVTNLIFCPMFLNASGEQEYHSCLHEMMGPLSILRLGGGPAVARAAVLARLLQFVRDPRTGRPFVTRVVSLTRDGGPTQVTRGYISTHLAPFWQHPGPVGAAAVDYDGGQTLLDPSALTFFVRSDGRLAAIEEVVADEALRTDGAGRLAPIYAKVDAEEVRRQRPDRLLSKGVFPELCPDEEGVDRPFDPRERQVLRTLVSPKGVESAPLQGFLDVFGRPGSRDAAVRVKWDDAGLAARVTVSGIDLGPLTGQDLEAERVHLLVDNAHDHTEFHHFLAGAAGERRHWREISLNIQTLFKHLSTDYYAELEEVKGAAWEASVTARPDGYEVILRLAWSVLGIEKPPTVIGLNVWIDGRRPYYEQVFLSPSRWQVPGDPFSFADLYLGDCPITLREIDFGIPAWGDNMGRARLANASAADVSVALGAENRLITRRGVKRLPEASATVPAGGEVEVELPFYVDPSVKMAQQIIALAGRRGEVEFFRAEWKISYMGPLSAYQRYGSRVRPAANPRPGEEGFLKKKILYICSRIPEFRRLTTRDGAASDFVLRAEDGSVEFNLMESGVLDRMAGYIEGLFDNDVDRVLGVFFLSYAPSVARHMSWGHRLMTGAGPLSTIRGNFAGGGGNCGYHARAFAGLASRLRIGGRPLTANVLGIWGHAIAAVARRGSRALIDPDVGHLLMTPDGHDLATIEEFRADPSTLSTAGPDEIARYYTANDDFVRALETMDDNLFEGAFPPGAPRS